MIKDARLSDLIKLTYLLRHGLVTISEVVGRAENNWSCCVSITSICLGLPLLHLTIMMRQMSWPPRANIRSWLMDTGCKRDLPTRAAVPTCQHALIEHANPSYLSTAHNFVSCDKTVPQPHGAFGYVAELSMHAPSPQSRRT